MKLLLDSALSSAAIGYTRTAPIVEKMMPTTSDSTTSIRTKDEPCAPRVRNNASSRMRCPTRTAKVFEITNEETSSASAAKAPKMTPRNANIVESCFFTTSMYSGPDITEGSVFLSPVLSFFCSSARAAASSVPLNLTYAMLAPGTA